MYTVKETLIVEGTYDKIKLSGFIDSIIFTTNGFAVFKNKQAQRSIRTFAEKTGIVILTDSDSAGIKIRNFVKQLAKDGRVLHAYIPELEGKEKRKTAPGKEGLLGVEGISEEIIMDAIRKSGATVNGERGSCREKKPVTKADFYAMGLSGGKNSEELRRKLAKKLGIPSKLSSNMLLSAVNRMLTSEELAEIIGEILL
ncbi:MAG: DUF4093 domain-containing protein [Clostridiales bacterium]|nr:DUF4093 domain-containing protein [Clostridiales bacterium]